jgi:hypothetical protein
MKMTKRQFLMTVTLGVLVIAMVVADWYMNPDENKGIQISKAPLPPLDEDQFVGSARCSVCHPRIAASYQAHSMFSSAGMIKPVAQNLKSKRFSRGPFSYLTGHESGQTKHYETLTNKKGETIVERVIDVHYEIGSGTRAKSYLTNADGVLIQSPLTWYSQMQGWELSPGYVPQKTDRFERRVGNACLFCHVGRTATIRRDWEDRFNTKKPFHETGIGCERCHGPGKRHAELHESGMKSITDHLIVNPKKIDSSLRDAICYQCHLSAKRVLRYGRQHYDVRPGNPLSSVWTIFDETAHEKEKDLAVSHVQQMHASRCFKGSGGKMSCLSCHDAHSQPVRKEKATFYRARCQSCHTKENDCRVPLLKREQSHSRNSCIVCHMPRNGTTDVIHLTQSDHRVPRLPHNPDVPRRKPMHVGKLRLFHTGKAKLPKWEISRGLGLALYQKYIDSQSPDDLKRAKQLLVESIVNTPEDVAVLRTLGAIFHLTRNNKEARKYLEAAVSFAPKDDDSLALLGVVCFRTGDYQAARKYFETSLELNPHQAEIHGRLAEILVTFGDRDAAIRTLKKGLTLTPTHTQLRSSLVRILKDKGDVIGMRKQQALLDRIRKRLSEKD